MFKTHFKKLIKSAFDIELTIVYRITNIGKYFMLKAKRLMLFTLMLFINFFVCVRPTLPLIGTKWQLLSRRTFNLFQFLQKASSKLTSWIIIY